jgi:hypothetical protein
MAMHPLPARAQTVEPEKASPNVPENPISKVEQHIQIHLIPFAAPPPGYSAPEPAHHFYSSPENIRQFGQIAYVPTQQTLFPNQRTTLPEREYSTTCNCTKALLCCISFIWCTILREDEPNSAPIS